MINILWQISSQTNNYTVTPGHVNSTTPFASTASSFTPSVAAERVNVCWFASLVLSLSTASFGILVKQWLREYLAIDNSKPEERLRIRHHRYLGLKSWKLFEIAAFLPLILQLSLALFFIGLCFFTASVHHSIGITSLVLVSGWALFFTFALLAPVLSSRCPYKTTFLKTPLRAVRLYALLIIVYVLLLIIVTTIWCCRMLRYRIAAILRGNFNTRILDEDIMPYAEHVDFFRNLQEEFNNPDEEENNISTKNTNDITIFATVDSLLLSDELLPAIHLALRQTHATSDEVLESRAVLNLALEVTCRRLRLDKVYEESLSWDTEKYLALHKMSSGVRTTLLAMVAEELQTTQWIYNWNMEALVWAEEIWLFTLVSGLASDGASVQSMLKWIVPASHEMLNSVCSRCEFIGREVFKPRYIGDGL